MFSRDLIAQEIAFSLRVEVAALTAASIAAVDALAKGRRGCRCWSAGSEIGAGRRRRPSAVSAGPAAIALFEREGTAAAKATPTAVAPQEISTRDVHWRHVY